MSSLNTSHRWDNGLSKSCYYHIYHWGWRNGIFTLFVSNKHIIAAAMKNEKLIIWITILSLKITRSLQIHILLIVYAYLLQPWYRFISQDVQHWPHTTIKWQVSYMVNNLEELVAQFRTSYIWSMPPEHPLIYQRNPLESLWLCPICSTILEKKFYYCELQYILFHPAIF